LARVKLLTATPKEKAMSRKITASPEELARQASMWVHQYFHAAIKSIDDKFGAGYAEKHPELIGSLVQAAASDFNTVTAIQTFQDFQVDFAGMIVAINGLRVEDSDDA
jgi:hypothetical protein